MADLTASRPAQDRLRSAPPEARLDSLTGLRFIAALLVVLNHSASIKGRIVDIPALDWPSRVGILGVPFFFALSGFVLTWSWRPDDRARRFYQRRFARVYPLHVAAWVITALAIIAAGKTIHAAGGALSLVLLQSWVPDTNVSLAVNGVSWTLSCEVFFYALTPLLLLWLVRRPGAAARLAVAALGLMTVAALLQGSHAGVFSTPDDMWFLPPFALGFFLTGIACSVAIRNGYRPVIPLWAGLSFAAVDYAITAALNAGWLHWFSVSLPKTYAGLLFVPGIVVLLLSVAGRDISGGERSWLARPAMVRLGEWSFALYLTHPLITRALDKVADVNPVGLAQNVGLEVAYLAAAIALAGFAYTAFERPLEARLRPPGAAMRATAEIPPS